MTVRGASRLESEIVEQVDVLRHVLDLRPDVLLRARTAVAGARRTVLVGIGSSRHVAGYGVSCLEALTTAPVAMLAAPGAGVILPKLQPDDVVIVVSQSGRTPALLSFVESVRAAGAGLVTVTSAGDSPLEQLADLALVTGAGPETVVPATKSVTASMLLLRALAGRIGTDQITQLCRAVDRVVNDEGQQVQHAVAGHGVPEVVVCAGFAAEAVSDEVALKLAEVVGSLAVAETVVDYLHGPAAVPARVLAFLDPLDPNGSALDRRPDTLRVSTALDAEVRLESTSDPTLDAIVRVVAGQFLALRWAERGGLNPDDARGLAKVTLTQ